MTLIRPLLQLRNPRNLTKILFAMRMCSLGEIWILRALAYEAFGVLGYHVGGDGEEHFLLGGGDVMVGFDFCLC
jgi:hypothetical protein